MSDDEGISIYDEVEIEDMTFDEAMGVYQFPCPCGDKFQITLEDLLEEQDIAVCPSCSLMIRVIFDLDDLSKPPTSGASGGQVPITA
ncbi:Diphthamide biosynthesis protein 3 [Fusarium chlamydosporum]